LRKKKYSNIPPPVNELRLRQLSVDEALVKLERYLNDAFMAGLGQISIIHGKGTGTLRRVVWGELEGHPLVKSYRLGGHGEGGAGVTVVELASR
jgi:DNA mismatch repair protein MutS2